MGERNADNIIEDLMTQLQELINTIDELVDGIGRENAFSTIYLARASYELGIVVTTLGLAYLTLPERNDDATV